MRKIYYVNVIYSMKYMCRYFIKRYDKPDCYTKMKGVSFSLKATVLIICLQCIDEVAVGDLVYRSLAQNGSSDFI